MPNRRSMKSPKPDPIPYLLPLPDEQGIDKFKEMYLNQIGVQLTDVQAADLLGRVMRFLYLLSQLPQHVTASEHQNQEDHANDNQNKSK